MIYFKAFRLAVIIDSVVFILKLSLPIYLLVDGVQRQKHFDKSEKYDSSYISELAILLIFIGGGILLISVLLRLMTNYYQYRNEQHRSHKRNYARIFCCSCCWFSLSIFNVALISLLIWIDWTHEKWLRKVAISFLCWEFLMLCFMVTFKSMICETTTNSNVVQNETEKSKEEINLR